MDRGARAGDEQRGDGIGVPLALKPPSEEAQKRDHERPAEPDEKNEGEIAETSCPRRRPRQQRLQQTEKRGGSVEIGDVEENIPRVRTASANERTSQFLPGRSQRGDAKRKESRKVTSSAAPL
ncbi:MAG: hypothetical protein H7343_14750 [Undibacterium sp.]|nr:hypothetical protein [Opitutaceae bacterium]